MAELSNKEIVDAVKKWQDSDKIFHCDNDNCWDILEPVIEEGKVVLKCINCGAIMAPWMLKNILQSLTPKP